MEKSKDRKNICKSVEPLGLVYSGGIYRMYYKKGKCISEMRSQDLVSFSEPSVVYAADKTIRSGTAALRNGELCAILEKRDGLSLIKSRFFADFSEFPVPILKSRSIRHAFKISEPRLFYSANSFYLLAVIKKLNFDEFAIFKTVNLIDYEFDFSFYFNKGERYFSPSIVKSGPTHEMIYGVNKKGKKAVYGHRRVAVDLAGKKVTPLGDFFAYCGVTSPKTVNLADGRIVMTAKCDTDFITPVELSYNAGSFNAFPVRELLSCRDEKIEIIGRTDKGITAQLPHYCDAVIYVKPESARFINIHIGGGGIDFTASCDYRSGKIITKSGGTKSALFVKGSDEFVARVLLTPQKTEVFFRDGEAYCVLSGAKGAQFTIGGDGSGRVTANIFTMKGKEKT